MRDLLRVHGNYKYPPATTRAFADLEQRLGIKLLNLTTRYVCVTDAGQRYQDDCRRILLQLTEADEVAIGINAAPRGHLFITAPVLFGRMYVISCVVEYHISAKLFSGGKVLFITPTFHKPITV